MKRVKKTDSVFLNNIVVFQEDIDFFYEVLKELSPDFDITINDFLLDNYNEISEVREKISEVTNIQFFNPSHLSFSINQNKAHICPFSTKLEVTGATERIHKRLLSCKRKISWISIFGSPITLNAGLWFALGSAVLHKFYSWSFLYIPIVVGVVMSIGSGIVIFSAIHEKSCNITLYYSKDRPSFWKRNSDKIRIAIITAIITGIFAYIIFLVTGKAS